MQRDPSTEERNRRRAVAIAVVAVLLIWLVWWQWDAIRGALGGGRAPAESAVGTQAVDETAPGREAEADEESIAAGRQRAVEAWRERLDSEPVWPADLANPADCAGIDRDLRALCAALDARPRFAAALGERGACDALRSITAGMAEDPPGVQSELRSYETLLGNLFHVSRALGRDRTRALVKALRDEPELIEPAAMTLHRWIGSRKACLDGRDDPFPLAVRYDYGVYLFRTLGGQAFLRRRSPEAEGLISFYALVTLDQARRERHDPQGVDLRPEIERTRALLASSSFVFRQEYLRELDAMADR